MLQEERAMLRLLEQIRDCSTHFSMPLVTRSQLDEILAVIKDVKFLNDHLRPPRFAHRCFRRKLRPYYGHCIVLAMLAKFLQFLSTKLNEHTTFGLVHQFEQKYIMLFAFARKALPKSIGRGLLQVSMHSSSSCGKKFPYQTSSSLQSIFAN